MIIVLMYRPIMRTSVVPCGHNVVGQGAPHTHALLLVYQETVALDFDVRLQLLLDALHLSQGLLGFPQLQLEQLDALFQLRHFFSQFSMRAVVTSLDRWSLYSVVCCSDLIKL